MSEREISTTDLIVPDLDILYNKGIINNITELYNLNKDNYLKTYPSLNNVDQEVIPVYMAYFAICNYYLEEGISDFTEFLSQLQNKKIITNLIDAIIQEFSYLLMELNLDESMYQVSYEEYQETFRTKLVKDPKVLKFMNELYNDRCINAVKGYILSTGGLSVEKIGLDLTSDELNDLGVYIFYSSLYSCYKTMCCNFVEKIQFKNGIKKLEVTDLYDLAETYFKAFDENLYSFDEYSAYLTKRKRFALEILSLSEFQYAQYKGASRKREE
ncbi:MAG: hypothetical protein IKX00_04115 [Bacilli bacterium]|nr:hypothetical protein [Bacilli bacterium]